MNKPGRNEPCPCGSGKKYKKCCFGKEEAEAAQRERDAEFQRTWMLAMNNMRRRTLEQKPHIKEYKKIRRLHDEIVSGMMNYYYDSDFQPTAEFDPDYKLPSKEIIIYESEFDPDTREGIHGLTEHVVYKAAPNISCLTEEFIRKNRYRKPEKIELLQSMLHSRAGLFEVTGIDSDEGFAFLREVFTGQEYKLTDTGLSNNQNHEEIYMYMRVITYQGVSFGTGLNLMFEKTDPFIISFIKREQKDYMPHAEYIRFIELYNRLAKYPSKYQIIGHSFSGRGNRP